MPPYETATFASAFQIYRSLALTDRNNERVSSSPFLLPRRGKGTEGRETAERRSHLISGQLRFGRCCCFVVRHGRNQIIVPVSQLGYSANDFHAIGCVRRVFFLIRPPRDPRDEIHSLEEKDSSGGWYASKNLSLSSRLERVLLRILFFSGKKLRLEFD